MIKTLLLIVSGVIYICIFPEQLQMCIKYTESKWHPFNIIQCSLIPSAWVNSSCLPNNFLLPLEISLWFQVDKNIAPFRSISLLPYFTGNFKASFLWQKKINTSQCSIQSALQSHYPASNNKFVYWFSTTIKRVLIISYYYSDDSVIPSFFRTAGIPSNPEFKIYWFVYKALCSSSTTLFKSTNWLKTGTFFCDTVLFSTFQ